MPNTRSGSAAGTKDVWPDARALDRQDRNLFTQPRRDATTGELLPESENVVDFAVRHGWTHDNPRYEELVGLNVRMYSPGAKTHVLDLRFRQASLRTITAPEMAWTGFYSEQGYVYRPVPLEGRTARAERFIVNPDCKCEPGSFGCFHDDGPNPECLVHGEAK